MVQRVGLAPFLTTRDRELVYVLEDKNRAMGLNPRPLSTLYAKDLCIIFVRHGWCRSTYARATLEKQSCVITSTLFEMNSTCTRWCDLNFSCLSTSITSAEVSSCQNKRRYPNPIWPTVFTFRVLKLPFCEFTTMVSLHLHKST